MELTETVERERSQSAVSCCLCRITCATSMSSPLNENHIVCVQATCLCCECARHRESVSDRQACPLQMVWPYMVHNSWSLLLLDSEFWQNHVMRVAKTDSIASCEGKNQSMMNASLVVCAFQIGCIAKWWLCRSKSMRYG
ncbi:hypothetical protein KP509_01G116600 [Ceratopteris richardii]|uniref:Uncharacterized protein n=1 Tax=Ceratopteris richardii TaxID=49495 RepID=A0A8T2VPS6_CERRI|nr:hypothetical protein KP509_01G116600 [Ceratopteris richardii]